MKAEASNNIAINNNTLRPNPAILDNLRNQIHQLEYGGKLSQISQTQSKTTVSLGNSDIDEALPWGGLPITGLHEIFGDIATIGFTTILINKLVKNLDAPILWCQHEYDLCGQGLTEFGINPDRIILIRSKRDSDILWAMEEGLRSKGISGVIGKPFKISPIAGRRLQLAAEENYLPCLLLRPEDRYKNPQSVTPTNAALTRWHVTTAPSVTPANGRGLGAPRWNLELQRYRYSAFNLQKQKNKQRKTRRVMSWQVEWRYETGDLSVVTNLCNRSNKPQKRQQRAS
jgi:protein ImuA